MGQRRVSLCRRYAPLSSNQALNLWSQIRWKGIPLLPRSYFSYICSEAAFILRLRFFEGSGFALDFDFGCPKSVLGKMSRIPASFKIQRQNNYEIYHSNTHSNTLDSPTVGLIRAVWNTFSNTVTPLQSSERRCRSGFTASQIPESNTAFILLSKRSTTENRLSIVLISAAGGYGSTKSCT